MLELKKKRNTGSTKGRRELDRIQHRNTRRQTVQNRAEKDGEQKKKKFQNYWFIDAILNIAYVSHTSTMNKTQKQQ